MLDRLFYGFDLSKGRFGDLLVPSFKRFLRSLLGARLRTEDCSEIVYQPIRLLQFREKPEQDPCPLLLVYAPVAIASAQLLLAPGQSFYQGLSIAQPLGLKPCIQPHWLAASALTLASLLTLLFPAVTIVLALLGELFQVFLELCLLAVYILDSFPLVFHAQFLDPFTTSFHDMEAVAYHHGIREGHSHDRAHAVAQVHGDQPYRFPILLRHLSQGFGNCLGVGALDNSNDGALLAMRILVVEDCVHLMPELRLVNTEPRAEVLGDKYSIIDILFLNPSGKIAQSILVGTRKGVVLNHVSPAQALGRHRLIVHPLSLKKAPAPWSMTYLRRLSSLPLPEEMRHSYHQL